jgi:hypothetical protein
MCQPSRYPPRHGSPRSPPERHRRERERNLGTGQRADGRARSDGAARLALRLLALGDGGDAFVRPWPRRADEPAPGHLGGLLGPPSLADGRPRSWPDPSPRARPAAPFAAPDPRSSGFSWSSRDRAPPDTGDTDTGEAAKRFRGQTCSPSGARPREIQMSRRWRREDCSDGRTYRTYVLPEPSGPDWLVDPPAAVLTGRGIWAEVVQ